MRSVCKKCQRRIGTSVRSQSSPHRSQHARTHHARRPPQSAPRGAFSPFRPTRRRPAAPSHRGTRALLGPEGRMGPLTSLAAWPCELRGGGSTVHVYVPVFPPQLGLAFNWRFVSPRLHKDGGYILLSSRGDELPSTFVQIDRSSSPAARRCSYRDIPRSRSPVRQHDTAATSPRPHRLFPRPHNAPNRYSPLPSADIRTYRCAGEASHVPAHSSRNPPGNSRSRVLGEASIPKGSYFPSSGPTRAAIRVTGPLCPWYKKKSLKTTPGCPRA